MLALESNIVINIPNYLPLDVALKIASSLPDKNICALGSCSRKWREICGSDSIWVSLSMKRWPSLFAHPSQLLASDPPIKDWKGFYAKRHKEIASMTASVVTFVGSDSINLQRYRRAHEQLASVQYSFSDVELFLFDVKLNVVLSLLGLHYSINYLKVLPEVVGEALQRRGIYEREVRVEWTMLVRPSFQCTLVSERRDALFSLGNLAMGNGDSKEEGRRQEVFGILEEDAIFGDMFVWANIFASD